MTLENMIRAIAGTFVLISLTLGYVHSPYWHLFTAFVGANLLQSAFTHWCLMENILVKAGLAKPAFTPDLVPGGGRVSNQLAKQQVTIRPPEKPSIDRPKDVS